MAKRSLASLRFWVLGLAFLLVVTNAPTGKVVADNFVCSTDPETAIPPNRVCDFVVDCANGADEVECGNCDFANTTCGWSLGDPGNRNPIRWQWIRVGELEGSPKLNSHRTTDGHYMILVREEESKYIAERAVASSPVIRNTNFLCAIWFYYNYANDTSTVELELEVEGYKIIVWSLLAKEPKQKQGTWIPEGVVLGRYPGEVKLNFLGNLSDAGYFVIDSIEYIDCRLPQPKHSCEDDFRCANGACTLRRDVCDFVDNCGDHSDELNCEDHKLGCNFDTSFCDWEPVVPSKNDFSFVKWVRSRPEKDLRYAPTRDHTTGLPTGRFLHLRAGGVKVESEISGPVLQVNGSCAITFFYVMYNGAPSTLKLGARYAKSGDFIKNIWEEKNHSGLFHFTKVYEILSLKNPFQVFFKGTHEATKNAAYISIDDVYFTPGCRPYEVASTTPDSATSPTDATPTKTGILPEAPVTPPPTEAPACPGGQFTCATSRQCIPETQVCDSKEHCEDGSDEKDCLASTTPDSATSLTDATPTKTVASTTPDSSTSSTNATQTKEGLAAGTSDVVIAVLVGLIALVAVFVGIVYLYQRRCRRREEHHELNEISGEQSSHLLSTSPSTDTDHSFGDESKGCVKTYARATGPPADQETSESLMEADEAESSATETTTAATTSVVKTQEAENNPIATVNFGDMAARQKSPPEGDEGSAVGGNQDKTAVARPERHPVDGEAEQAIKNVKEAAMDATSQSTKRGLDQDDALKDEDSQNDAPFQEVKKRTQAENKARATTDERKRRDSK